MMKARWIVAFLAVAFTATFAADEFDRPDFKSLVAAEEAFAKLSADTNIRNSFLANFADDGVVFNPQPVNAKELYSKKPIPPNPPPVTLFWEPIFAEVSRAGDLGYTTGPYYLKDNVKKAPAAQGFFFSVWKRQSDGKWKVVLDFGIETPPLPDHSEPVLGTRISSTKEPKALSGSDWKQRKQEFLEAENHFSIVSQDKGVSAAYAQYLHSGGRLNRNGMFPLSNGKAVDSYFKNKTNNAKWVPIGSDLSKSGDLGYVYGSYEQQDGGKKGYYARAWQRDAKGQWKIVIETARDLDEKK
jgi:ketosteroid isomerase-like protein